MLPTTASTDAIFRILRKYPRTTDHQFPYGTAGFRFDAVSNFSDAEAIFARAGLLAQARALVLGRTVGLCVTASHNPWRDNGVKLVDPHGGMLDPEWETLAFEIANAKTDVECVEGLMRGVGEAWRDGSGIKLVDPHGGVSDPELETLAFEIANSKTDVECVEGLMRGVGGSEVRGLGMAEGVMGGSEARVLVARDTRPHSERLAGVAMEGAMALRGAVEDLGVLTTPQLHFCVATRNGMYRDGGNETYDATEKGYVELMTGAFLELVQGAKPKHVRKVLVDCANGVGALKFPAVLEKLKSTLTCEIFNGDITNVEALNDECGAEHVQKMRLAPKNLPPNTKLSHRFASFDGDADRIVFYSFKPDGSLRLLDGDKIASLLARFVQTQVKALDLSATIGCVQTAYANGSSSQYLQNVLGVEAPLVKTGVKHLHHKALDYDVGVYFEANGHGTVLFRPTFLSALVAAKPTSEEAKTAQKRLIALTRVLNQTTGDAISDFLAVEGVLRVLDIDDEEWDALYYDLPSRQLKVKVKDRTVIQTTADESRCVQPEALQLIIDELVKSYNPCARAFVRPSGTEDVVRVYAEAATEEASQQLAEAVSRAVFDLAGGVGERLSSSPQSGKKSKMG